MPPALRTTRLSWLSPSVARTEVLAGLVVALALIPEAISFSILAGVDPRVGLFSSFVMAVVISFTGGRPAMITAATGAIALVVAPLVREHGLQHLLAAVVLGGVFQIALGLAGFARLMRFIPRSVMVGFVNALAILIFTAQLPQLVDVPWFVYPPGRRRPHHDLRAAALHDGGALTARVDRGPHGADGVRRPCRAGRRESGELPDSLPFFALPDLPLTRETLQISRRTRTASPSSA